MLTETQTCVKEEPNVLFGNPTLFSETLCYVQEPELVFRNPMVCLGTQYYYQEPYVNVQEPELPCADRGDKRSLLWPG